MRNDTEIRRREKELARLSEISKSIGKAGRLSHLASQLSSNAKAPNELYTRSENAVDLRIGFVYLKADGSVHSVASCTSDMWQNEPDMMRRLQDRALSLVSMDADSALSEANEVAGISRLGAFQD